MFDSEKKVGVKYPRFEERKILTHRIVISCLQIVKHYLQMCIFVVWGRQYGQYNWF